MTYLYLGIVLFGGVHLFSMLAPAARDQLKQRIGVGAYRGVYSLVSLAGLVLLAVGYMKGRSGPASLDMVYEPLFWARHITITLAWLGFVLIAASHGKGYLRKLVKHPMSVGVALWSIGHLLVNGERPVVYIFAMFLVLAVVDIVLSSARGKAAVFEPRVRSDIIALVAGTAVFLVLAFGFHPYVLNIPVIG